MATKVIDDAALAELASRPDVVAEFPIFAQRRGTVVRSCCRSGGAKQDAGKSGSVIRQAILHMGGERISRLKQLLGVDVLVIWTMSGNKPVSTSV